MRALSQLLKHSHVSYVVLGSTRDQQQLHARHALLARSQQRVEDFVTSALLVSSVVKAQGNASYAPQGGLLVTLDQLHVKSVRLSVSHQRRDPCPALHAHRAKCVGAQQLVMLRKPKKELVWYP